jgi:glycosyltransferase involved in cell wall biosynthesis
MEVPAHAKTHPMPDGGSGAALEVMYVQRRPMGAQVSIERLFDQVRRALGTGIRVRVHVSPYPSLGLLPRLGNLWFAWRACRGRLCHLTGDVQYLAMILPRGRLVLTIHDCAILHRLRGWRRELIRLLWFEWPARRAAVVTTISETTRDDLKQWLSPDLAGKLRVVPNCVGSEFVASPRAWNATSPVFLQVGTGWNKNLRRVAEAMAGLSCQLWIVGPVAVVECELMDALGVSYKCLGRLSDAELTDAYRDCDALIFASLFEGFGLPILEAQATGRPVITSKRSSMPEVAGDGALFVDPENVQSIRSAVGRVMANEALRKSLVARGFVTVRRFEAGAVAASYETIYREFPVGPHEAIFP